MLTFMVFSANRAILKSNCYHKEGHEAPCKYGDAMYMLLFGVVQVIMSFIPDFHNMALLSVVAAIMSFSYSSIGLGLGITKVIGKVHVDVYVINSMRWTFFLYNTSSVVLFKHTV